MHLNFKLIQLYWMGEKNFTFATDRGGIYKLKKTSNGTCNN